MKYYVQFLTENALTGEIMPALGSDAVFILDDRNRLDTMIYDARKRKYQLRKVRKFTGFWIMKGTRFDDSNKKLYEEITG